MANKFPYYPVFVYGTLMSGFSNHKKICENVLYDIQYGEFRGGFLCHFIDDNPKEGFELGYVDILEAKSKSQIAKGELLYFKKDNSYDTIKKIDKLFGFTDHKSKNNIYTRKLRYIYDIVGNRVPAFVYIGSDNLHNNIDGKMRLMIPNYTHWKKFIYDNSENDYLEGNCENDCLERNSELYPFSELKV